MNAENDRAVSLRKEVEFLERERKALLASTAIEATGLGKHKGFPIGAIVGVGKNSADVLEINEKIREKKSTLTFAIQTQNSYQKRSEQLERKIKDLQQRLDQMGCT